MSVKPLGIYLQNNYNTVLIIHANSGEMLLE